MDKTKTPFHCVGLGHPEPSTFTGSEWTKLTAPELYPNLQQPPTAPRLEKDACRHSTRLKFGLIITLIALLLVICFIGGWIIYIFQSSVQNMMNQPEKEVNLTLHKSDVLKKNWFVVHGRLHLTVTCHTKMVCQPLKDFNPESSNVSPECASYVAFMLDRYLGNSKKTAYVGILITRMRSELLGGILIASVEFATFWTADPPAAKIIGGILIDMVIEENKNDLRWFNFKAAYITIEDYESRHDPKIMRVPAPQALACHGNSL